eukprot:gene11100-14103_t
MEQPASDKDPCFGVILSGAEGRHLRQCQQSSDTKLKLTTSSPQVSLFDSAQSSGTMGNGIAHVFAQHGYAVSLVDVNEAALKKALDTIAKNLDRQVAKG